MKVTWRRVLLSMIMLLGLLVVGAWLGDRWLEGSGGRAMLEQELERRTGLPVRLQGDFDLMLLPSIGVAGTGFAVGRPRDGQPLLSGKEYEISVALRPLLKRELLVEWLRVSELEFGGQAGGGPGGADEPIRIRSLVITGFAENRETAFEMEVESIGSASGTFRWVPARQVLRVNALRISTAGGDISGWACIGFAAPPVVNVDLSARSLDLDALGQAMPGSSAGVSGRDSGVLPGLNLRLMAGELLAAGAIARDVEFSIGAAPACDE